MHALISGELLPNRYMKYTNVTFFQKILNKTQPWCKIHVSFCLFKNVRIEWKLVNKSPNSAAAILLSLDFECFTFLMFFLGKFLRSSQFKNAITWKKIDLGCIILWDKYKCLLTFWLKTVFFYYFVNEILKKKRADLIIIPSENQISIIQYHLCVSLISTDVKKFFPSTI